MACQEIVHKATGMALGQQEKYTLPTLALC